MRRLGAGLIGLVLALGLLTACGSEEKRYSDDKIIERLDLEKTEKGYTIDGDPFCEVERKLLNNANEVEAAAEKDDLGLVISSREGNAGVTGVAPFAPDCGEQAEKRLSRMDPKPKE